MDEKEALTPHEALEKQKKFLEDTAPEPHFGEILAEQNVVLAKSLLTAVEKCDDARQFGAVARLALATGQFETAAELLNVMIASIDTIMGGHYDDIEDRDLVDVVEAKLNPPSVPSE